MQFTVFYNTYEMCSGVILWMYLVDRNITNSQMRKKFSIEFSRKRLDLNIKNLLISLL